MRQTMVTQRHDAARHRMRFLQERKKTLIQSSASLGNAQHASNLSVKKDASRASPDVRSHNVVSEKSRSIHILGKCLPTAISGVVGKNKQQRTRAWSRHRTTILNMWDFASDTCSMCARWEAQEKKLACERGQLNGERR